MDQGYRMLRHVVQQVFGNLAQAMRLTLVLTFFPTLALFAVFYQFGPQIPGEPAAISPGLLFLASILAVVASFVCSAWAAVGWHRFVLREEYGNGVFPIWHGANIRAYILGAVVVGIVVVATFFLFGLVLSLLTAALRSSVAFFLVGTGVVLGASWIAVRVGLILPAAAVGERMSVRESWALTKPVSTDILVPLLVISLAMTLLSGLITALHLPLLPTSALEGLASWLQILLNLSLMTTLYGVLVERRTLN